MAESLPCSLGNWVFALGEKAGGLPPWTGLPLPVFRLSPSPILVASKRLSRSVLRSSSQDLHECC